MTAAAVASYTDRAMLIAPVRQRSLGMSVWRSLIYCLLFSLILVPEFVRNAADQEGIIYAKAIGGFRYVDLAILGLALTHLLGLGCLRRKSLSFPRAVAIPGLAFVLCIAVAAAYGRSQGGTNIFFDWRALALGVALYVVWSFWLQTSEDVVFAIRLFAAYMAARIGLLYLLYILGYRETLLGVSIPVFDGPVLSAIVFTGLLAFRFQNSAGNRRQRLAWICLTLASCLMVLLCMRRTYWAELAIGILVLALLQKRDRARNLTIVGLVIFAAALILGSTLLARLRSFDLSQDKTQFSADNADHLHDLVDAWDRVRLSPVMGIGLGTSYSTWHSRRWKAESVMVHNAPLHVWLKYGLAALCCYLWFHVALLRWLFRKSRAPAAQYSALLAAVFAFLSAQFVVTLGFAPWPYSELQLTTLTSFILAAAIGAARERALIRQL